MLISARKRIIFYKGDFSMIFKTNIYLASQIKKFSLNTFMSKFTVKKRRILEYNKVKERVFFNTRLFIRIYTFCEGLIASLQKVGILCQKKFRCLL